METVDQNHDWHECFDCGAIATPHTDCCLICHIFYYSLVLMWEMDKTEEDRKSGKLTKADIKNRIDENELDLSLCSITKVPVNHIVSIVFRLSSSSRLGPTLP